VDAETWALAQQQLQLNRERARRNNTRHQYLLRGLLICGRCGRRLTGHWQATGRRYRCKTRDAPGVVGACRGRGLQAQMIEAAVWEYVTELLADPALLRARYDEGQGEPALDGGAQREQERLRRQLAALEREGGRLVDAYQAGVIELAELRERRERLAEQGRLLGDRLTELGQRQADRERELRLLTGMEAFCASVRAALDAPSFETQQQVLQLVVDRIVVEDGRVVVHHVVPAGPVQLRTEHLSVEPGQSQPVWLTGGGAEAFINVQMHTDPRPSRCST
jgi:site-specific DNA recombinase